MKFKLFLTVAVIMFAIGCEEKQNEVNFIYNYELDFFTDDSVSTPAMISKSEWREENAELLRLANEVKSSFSNFPSTIDLSFRIFISDEGKVVAIKKLNVPSKENAKVADALWIKIGRYLSSKNITPALKAGKAVNYRKDLALGFETVADSLQLIIPNFVDLDFSMHDFNYDSSVEEGYFNAVEQMPEPIGGIRAIAEKVIYPEIAKRAGIEGKVFVKALIDEKGNVVGTKIIKGIGAGCDEAAMTAIMHTRFTPGRQRGEAVKVQVSIPIVFKLQ